MPDAGHIFLSYARADREFADRLSEDLLSRGVPVWRDVENIEAGTNWQKAIVRALDDAAGLIFVASRHSIESPWIARETEALLRRSVTRVFPIVIDDLGEERMPAPFRDVQWVDFRPDYQVALQALMEGVSRVVDVGAPRQQAPDQTKGYVFISYAESDMAFVEDLRSFLSSHGYAYWDYNESERDYHSQLFLELEAVVLDASATLSVLSPAWKKSIWTVKEYLFSDEVGTPVFLLRAKELGPTLVIAGMPYIDFVASPPDGFKRLERELARKGL